MLVFLVLLGYNFNNFISFVTLANTKLRLPEDDADASQHVGMLINIIDFYICCAFQFILHVH